MLERVMMVVLAAAVTSLFVAMILLFGMGDVIDYNMPDGKSYFVDGYLVDIEYVGGAFGYRARTVFFFDDGRVINVADSEQVSVELNTTVCLELQKSKKGNIVHLIDVEIIGDRK